MCITYSYNRMVRLFRCSTRSCVQQSEESKNENAKELIHNYRTKSCRTHYSGYYTLLKPSQASSEAMVPFHAFHFVLSAFRWTVFQLPPSNCSLPPTYLWACEMFLLPVHCSLRTHRDPCPSAGHFLSASPIRLRLVSDACWKLDNGNCERKREE